MDRHKGSRAQHLLKSTAGAGDASALVLRADGICRSFGSRGVIRDFSIQVCTGQVIAVRGPNGSGKSTLLRMLAGLLRPTRGAAWVEVDGRRAPQDEARRLIALAAPAIQPYVHLSLMENLVFFSRARGLRHSSGEAAGLCDLIGLHDRRHDLVESFSSGMLQRTRLALALVARPPVLLLDEPSQCLDDSGRALLSRIVGEQRQRGLCVIATNDAVDAALADAEVFLQGQNPS